MESLTERTSRNMGGIGKERRKIIFHSVVWGDEFLEPFFSYTVPSLLQEGNIPALVKAGYELELTMYSHPEEYERVAAQYAPCLDRLRHYVTITVIPLDGLETGWWSTGHFHYVTGALIDQIKRCIGENAMMFDTRPDTIYGNRSITNAVMAVRGKEVCLAAAHPRVNKKSIQRSDVLERLKTSGGNIENEQLVDLAFAYAHQSLLGCFDNEDSNMTHTGISIRKIDRSTYSVIHNVPMIWLANFVKDDLKFFASPGPYWDDRWESRWPRFLLRQNRLKLSGSSDLFFCIDLTAEEERSVPMEQGLLNNDRFRTRRRRYLHNYVFNSFCSVWRGRGDDPSCASTEPSPT